MPLQLVARCEGHFELLEREPLRIAADVLTSGVLAHPALEERDGVALPATTGRLTVPAAIDVIVDPQNFEEVLGVLGVAGLVHAPRSAFAFATGVPGMLQ
jgi:hypothetical protein